MFNKLKQKVYTLEVVMDALLTVLHNKGTVTREDIQIQILKNEAEGEEEDELG